MLLAKEIRSPDTRIRQSFFEDNRGPSQTGIAATAHDKPLVESSQQPTSETQVHAEKKRYALIV